MKQDGIRPNTWAEVTQTWEDLEEALVLLEQLDTLVNGMWILALEGHLKQSYLPILQAYPQVIDGFLLW